MTEPRKRGRPHGSVVRQNIVNILHHMKKAHGYDIAKVYINIFPKVSQRLIYYHLNRGVQLDEFQVEVIKTETGDYSWGSTAERKFYSLSINAKPKENERIERYLKIREIKI